MIFLLLMLAIFVVWITIRFSRPASENSTIYYHLPQDQFCVGPHKWKPFKLLFSADVYQDLENNITKIPHGSAVMGLLKHGLFCMQCNFVSGSESRAVDPSEFVLTLTKALEEFKEGLATTEEEK